jgi:prophage regulatory protein
MTEQTMKVLGYRDLRDHGIPWTRQHISKLVRLGRFPRPFKVGDKTNAWTSDEISNYLKDRIAMREAK